MGTIADILNDLMSKLTNSNGSARADDREIEMVEDTASIRYSKEKRALLPDIEKASAESPEIGGGDVIVTFARAEDEAEKLHWDAATKLLQDAHRKAGLVLKRKPFLTLKVANEPKIKAASKIKVENPGTQKKYGEEVEAKWKAILELAKKGDIAN